MASTSHRLIFTLSGDRLALEAAVEVEAMAPASNDIAAEGLNAPFYCELQDEDGRVLYRRRRPSPIGPTFEVPTGDPDRPFENRAGEQPADGAFSLLVPAHPASAFVELFRTETGHMPGPVTSLGRFDLREVPRTWTPSFLAGGGP